MRGKLISFWVAVFIVSFATLCASSPSAAQQNQSVATLASFAPLEYGFDYPGPLFQAADGNFYGTSCIVIPSLDHPTQYGYSGELFQLAPDGSLRTIASFPHVHSENGLGWGPFSGVVQDDEGNFYGTTWVHGATADILAGMVYKVTTAGELIPLHYFSGDDGVQPHAQQLVRGNDGSFYGTTLYGGLDDNGTVYRITPDGDFTTLYRFTGGADGANPFSALIQAGDGDFYGTTVTGGANGGGTIFRITQDGQLTPLYSFAEGDSAFAGLVQAADGNFYGRTVNTLGGATIFQLTSGGDFNAIYAFPSGTDDEVHSVALTPGNDGRF